MKVIIKYVLRTQNILGKLCPRECYYQICPQDTKYI